MPYPLPVQRDALFLMAVDLCDELGPDESIPLRQAVKNAMVGFRYKLQVWEVQCLFVHRMPQAGWISDGGVWLGAVRASVQR